jgi:hypothetical protein
MRLLARGSKRSSSSWEKQRVYAEQIMLRPDSVVVRMGWVMKWGQGLILGHKLRMVPLLAMSHRNIMAWRVGW